LKSQAVNLWVFRHHSHAEQEMSEALLTVTPSEISTFNRQANPEDQIRSLFARFWIRRALATELNVLPQAIVFSKSERGKPTVQTPDPGDLQFSVSHAREITLLAVTRGTPIGVDIESASQTLDLKALAPTVLSHDEMMEFDATPASKQNRFFLKIWCRKEACLKAAGLGLIEPLTQINVLGSLAAIPRELTAFSLGKLGPPTLEYQIEDIAVDPNHLAALAVASSCKLLYSIQHL